MFKNKFLYLILAGTVTVGALTSCNDFLDVIPDNRTEIDSKVKAQELLVSAYPQVCFAEMGELMSDNVTDNGVQYNVETRLVGECYNWSDASEQAQDSPTAMWQESYKAIAATNQVLEYVDGESDKDLQAIKGEALMARAFAHFFLVNVFCQQYNPETSDTDLGVPYVDNPNYSITDVPSRGTVKEVYEKIERDILAGLPLVDDLSYSSARISRYHFNRKAAYAFAARFYIYYGKPEEAVKYASQVLGSDPTAVLRNYKDFTTMSSAEDIGKTWGRADRDNNFLVLAVNSWWSLTHQRLNQRYNLNQDKANEVFWAKGPWGDPNNTYIGKMVYGSNEVVMIPKYYRYVEIIDVVSGSAYLHLIHTEFTGDETLLNRAEAYALQNKFDEAAADLSTWAKNYTITGMGLTREMINNFMEKEAIPSMKPVLNPKFTTINAGEQTNFIQFILWARRCETVHTGVRWFDIKRYGLEVVHKVAGGADMVLPPNDLRRVIQIPEKVISSGIQANPR